MDAVSLRTSPLGHDIYPAVSRSSDIVSPSSRGIRSPGWTLKIDRVEFSVASESVVWSFPGKPGGFLKNLRTSNENYENCLATVIHHFPVVFAPESS